MKSDGTSMRYQYPMSGIDYPGMNDVMCGRGGGTNHHIGNIRFRQLVNEQKLRYLAASKVDKPKVSTEVVQIWRALNPPGRFLTKTDASKGDDSLWHDVGDKKAREKASQCLRERTPDVMSFVTQIQAQESMKIVGEKMESNRVEVSKSLKAGSDTTSGASPDATISLVTPGSTLATPDITQSSDPTKISKKSRRSRDDVAQTIPTAAALMENVFDDEDYGDEDDSNSETTFQKQMQDFMESTKGGNGDEYSITDRSIVMDTMSSNSKDWVKSFQSLGSSSAMMSIGTSLREATEDGADLSAVDSDGKTRLQKEKSKSNGCISMLSDLADLSYSRQKSTRLGKMNGSKAMSNFSVLSELTDLSEGLKDMGLKRGLD
mmetsp:Transcript_37111/g.42343  ORF Transcript_37111/g.42343 Transcript_37111/m.42343 type:complete len:376 (-) Transcript_37111:199-1326(-)